MSNLLACVKEEKLLMVGSSGSKIQGYNFKSGRVSNANSYSTFFYKKSVGKQTEGCEKVFKNVHSILKSLNIIVFINIMMN